MGLGALAKDCQETCFDCFSGESDNSRRHRQGLLRYCPLNEHFGNICLHALSGGMNMHVSVRIFKVEMGCLAAEM